MEIFTHGQYRLLIKFFKGDTSRRSRDCWRQHFFAKLFFALKLKVLYIVGKEILYWSIFLLGPTSENVLSSSNTCSKSRNWRHQFLAKLFLPRNLKCYISLKRKFWGKFLAWMNVWKSTQFNWIVFNFMNIGFFIFLNKSWNLVKYRKKVILISISSWKSWYS